MRRQSRLLERRYRRTKHPYDRLAWVQMERERHRINYLKENGYWVSRVAEPNGQPRKAFSSIMDLDRAAEITIATRPSAQELLDYFVKKIELIRKSTGNSLPTSALPTPVETFSTFRTYSIDEVQKIINSKPIKSCSQDPIPANIFRQFLPELLPFITGMCNRSLQEGWLPVSQQHAIVRPIVKKDGLDPGDTKNYRPVSNLTFLSILIERMVCQQLTAFLEKLDLLPRLQSGFRGNHSTETALLKVLSDILMAADIGMVSLLGLLDNRHVSGI